MTESSGDRVAILVHEVRSPVAALAAVAEAMSGSPGDSPGHHELVRLAVGACAAIERIVTDIAVASVRPVLVDVGALVHDVVTSRAIGGANVEAHVEASLPLVDGDPVRLRQALDNLIVNALMHGDAAETVDVRATRTPTGVALSVGDAGQGISPEDLGRIFEPGVRLDESRPGSGLGLALTRAIVTAHGGSLDVDSSPSLGSTFTIRLPAAPAHPET
ncbi:MAG TPA: HAMP domain-containing sensor histidine kinase [Gaiellaceae bacterium]|nr:HAMP domain-containing sensor histidine kinase [Gaiellaceae bacterium]